MKMSIADSSRNAERTGIRQCGRFGAAGAFEQKPTVSLTLLWLINSITANAFFTLIYLLAFLTINLLVLADLNYFINMVNKTGVLLTTRFIINRR